MVITINKDTKPDEIDAGLKKLSKNRKSGGMAKYYGKLKGAFGDGLEYQKNSRYTELSL